MYATAFVTEDAASILLDQGADPNLKNAFDATALMWSVSDPVKLKLLLSEGAQPNARAKSGCTSILLAAMSAAAGESVQILAAHHADPAVSHRVHPLDPDFA